LLGGAFVSLDPISAGLDLAKDLIDRFVPDKQKAAELRAQADAAAAANDAQKLHDIVQMALAQLDVDKAEAASASVFVAGWRPGIGWVCGIAFGWNYVLEPFMQFVATLCGHPVTMPSLDLSGMMPVLLGMLGLGAMRTVEKVQGAAPPTHA